jgi:anti-sigma factor RsiW
MDHDQAFELLPGYVDEELSLSEAREVERHLADCPDCQEVLEQQRHASRQLRGADLRVEAPPELAKRIRAALPLRRSLWQRVFGAPSSSASGASGSGAVAGRGGASLGWAPLGAMAVSFGALAWSAGLYLSTPPRDTSVTQELVDSHVRSLQFDHLYDVISTDRHTVKPWFDGKIDFAPPVIDLAQEGYPLVGGRLDYLNGRAVAVMVYRYKLHPINLYVWPGNEAGATPHIEERKGYHLARWSAAGMNYWAITDAGESELSGFVNGLRAHSAS